MAGVPLVHSRQAMPAPGADSTVRRAPRPPPYPPPAGIHCPFWQSRHGRGGPQFVVSDSILENLPPKDLMAAKRYFLLGVESGWSAYASAFPSSKHFSHPSKLPQYATGIFIVCCNHLFIKRRNKGSRMLWAAEWQSRKAQIFENLSRSYADLSARCGGNLIVCFLGVKDDWFPYGQNDQEGTYAERWDKYVAETFFWTLQQNVKAVWLPAVVEEKTPEYAQWLRENFEGDREFVGRKYRRLTCSDGWHPDPCMASRFRFLFDVLNRFEKHWPDCLRFFDNFAAAATFLPQRPSRFCKLMP